MGYNNKISSAFYIDSRKMRCFFTFLFLLLMVMPIFGCSNKVPQTFLVHNGRADLSHWDFNLDGNFKVEGDWEFYWNEIISPGEFAESPSKLTGFYPVPLYWTKYKDLNLPSKGSATYRVVVDIDEPNQIMSIKTPEIYTQYSLWINNECIDSNGSFVSRAARYLRPDIYTFYVDGQRIEIVLQIKNYAHSHAGIGQNLIIGVPDMINKERSLNMAVDMVLFSICFCAGVYHSILSLYRRREPEIKYFALMCFAVGTRTILSNETCLLQIFREIPFEVGSRLLTMTVPVCAVSILSYIRILYNREMSKAGFYFFNGLGCLYMVLILTTDTFVYSSLFNYYLCIIAAGCIYIMYCVMKGRKRYPQQSAILFIGFIFIVLSAFNDMLFYNQFINTGYWLSLGLSIFIAAQAITIVIGYTNAYKQIENLSEKQKVLLEQVRITEMAFLRAQIKPHFIFNVLNVIASFCETSPQKAEELIVDLADYIRLCFDIKNIDDYVTLDREVLLVKYYIGLESARFEDRLNFIMNIDENLMNKKVPHLIIQPLVENSVRHGIQKKAEGGTVRLDIKAEAEFISIIVSDDGVGMDELKIKEIMDGNLKERKGVGLYNINSRLVRLYGYGIKIQSRQGEGTRIIININREEG